MLFRWKALGKRAADPSVLACSFCSKSQHDVKKLIAGPAVFICDECIQVCVEILAKEQQGPTGADGDESSPAEAADLAGLAPVSMPCALCRMITVTDDLLVVHDRGGLCPGCVAAFEAALETGEVRSRQRDTHP